MEKIDKYNSYDTDLKSSDIVVFKNGERRTIKRIEGGHRALFTNGNTCDLWINEDKILGVIHMKVEKPKPVVRQRSGCRYSI